MKRGLVWTKVRRGGKVRKWTMLHVDSESEIAPSRVSCVVVE